MRKLKRVYLRVRFYIVALSFLKGMANAYIDALEKHSDRSEEPWREYSLEFHFDRLAEELIELRNAHTLTNVKKEVADCGNFSLFVFLRCELILKHIKENSI